MLFSLIETSDGAIAVLGVDNPAYSRNVWGSIFLAKTEPFLPIPAPSELPTPISTPISTSPGGNLILNLATPIIIAVLIAAIIISVLLFRRHRKTSNLKQ